MRTDALQQFVKLRRQLTEEKNSLESRLHRINEALGEMGVAATSSPALHPTPAARPSGGGARQMSPEARARIADAQRRRWAQARKGQAKPASASASSGSQGGQGGGGRRKMSPAARRALAEIARKRWAAVKAAGKTAL